MTPAAARAWARLALAPEIGPVLAHRLLAEFGTAEAIFAAPAHRLREVPGLGAARLAALLDPQVERAAAEELERTAAAGAQLIPLSHPAYPALLHRLPQPPVVLWVRGRLAPQDRLALAVVGPRQPSQYARLMAQALSPPLAAHGLTLVSGMAYGIDAEAHRAALDAPAGRTLAVIGQGLGTPIYPQANAELAARIAAEDRGAVVSVFPCATAPAAHLFPLRNEVIAGLALGTLVIEAAPESGALITARHAAANHRAVLACPGDATRRAAQGANRLLAEGAALVQKAEDVLAALAQEMRHELAALEAAGVLAPAGPGTAPAASTPPPRSTGAPAPVVPADSPPGRILALLAAEPLPGDVIMEQCAAAGLALPQVLEALLQLEMAGAVRQLPGRLYALKP